MEDAMNLTQFWKENTKAAIAFSGGVDSAYLLYSAIQAGASVKAYFVKTVFQPAFELEDAKKLAAQLGAEMEIHPGRSQRAQCGRKPGNSLLLLQNRNFFRHFFRLFSKRNAL